MLTMSIGCTAAAMFVNVTMSLNKIVTEANFSVRRENINFEQNIQANSDSLIFLNEKKLKDISPVVDALGFKARVDPLACMLHCLCTTDSSSSPLV